MFAFGQPLRAVVSKVVLKRTPKHQLGLATPFQCHSVQTSAVPRSYLPSSSQIRHGVSWCVSRACQMITRTLQLIDVPLLEVQYNSKNNVYS